MRLLNTRTIKLESFADNNVPAYPILSHTWGDDEILFEDVQRGTTANWRHKAGCAKVLGAADWARHMGYDYLWVDSCCIDKASSAELSEAINSMYKWYQQSAICFAYLSDVRHSSFEHDFPRTRWFTRGWTLQELIAPRNVHFYDVNWAYLGNRRELALVIEKITQINLHILLSKITLSEISVSCRMAWAAGRVTTRKEDEAYCLMGIFDVNMPLLYGEGDKAFRRLLEEIIRRSNDHTVLLCGLISDFPAKCAILAPNPTCFRRGREFIKSSGSTSSYLHVQGNTLQLSVLMAPGPFGHDLAILDGSYAEDPTNLSRPALELGEYHGSYIRQNMDILKVTPVDGYSAKVKSESQEFRLELNAIRRRTVTLSLTSVVPGLRPAMGAINDVLRLNPIKQGHYETFIYGPGYPSQSGSFLQLVDYGVYTDKRFRVRGFVSLRRPRQEHPSILIWIVEYEEFPADRDPAPFQAVMDDVTRSPELLGMLGDEQVRLFDKYGRQVANRFSQGCTGQSGIGALMTADNIQVSAKLTVSHFLERRLLALDIHCVSVYPA